MPWPPLLNTPVKHETFGDRAPIVEALIEVRTATSPEAPEDAMSLIVAQLKERYPKRQNLEFNVYESWNTGDSQPEPRLAGKDHRLTLRNPDSGFAAVVRKDRISVSKLAPYLGWDMLKEEFDAVWKVFSDVLKPDRITRCGLRYINRIILPEHPTELHDWFTFVAELPNHWPDISKFTQRIEIPLPEEMPGVILLQFSTEGIIPLGLASVMLDLDAIYIFQPDQGEKPVEEVIDMLRGYKNDVFFDCLRERTKQLFRGGQ
ncbi:MAG: hypothetical protein ACI8RZ_000779 [Myxococcota bacterium]|jgi:uncharacterized protein (TIGR04255 family)